MLFSVVEHMRQLSVQNEINVVTLRHRRSGKGSGIEILYILMYICVQNGEGIMKIVSFTEFRNHASEMMTAVEHGETLLVVRHGRPIAQVSPATERQPSWKQPALRLPGKVAGLSSAIAEERQHEALP